MKDLKFYYMKSCPYCIKVKNYMKNNNINVEMLDIHEDPKNQEDLVSIGGKDQVPMLLIEGKPLYESSDIIEWFKENYL